MRKDTPPVSPPRRIAAFLALETEHGRSILRGIARYLRGRPEVTVLKFGQTEDFALASLKQLRVDGIIAKIATAHDHATLSAVGVPVINVSGQFATPATTTINTDDLRVGQMALQHLRRRGYQHFGYCGSATHLASQLRLRAFREEAQRLLGAAAKVDAHYLPWGDQTAPYPEWHQNALMRWVGRLPKPAGIFTFTDRVALEVEEASRRLGLSVPEEVAILGVGNDLTRLEFAHVELSSIQLNPEQIGFLAAETLLQQIASGKQRTVDSVLVAPVKIVTRRSTDLYAVGDEAVSVALDYVREHLGNAIYVADIARAAGVSRRGLEMRFRAALGTSVYDEVRRQQLELAANLLSEAHVQIGEVAFRSGFSSNAAFTRAFRQWSGKSPRVYRASLGR